MRVASRQQGFSLVEVLCAILILGVGMVGLTQGLTTALRSSKESEIQTAAALLAAGRIELLRAEGIFVDGTEEGEGLAPEGNDEEPSPFRWQQIITSTDLAGLHDVKVIVQNAQSGQPIYELQTLLFDPPVDTATSQTEPRGRRDDRGGEKKRRP